MEDSVVSFFADRETSIEETGESLLWQAVLSTLAHDIKFNASHRKPERAEKRIREIMGDARSWRCQEICGFLCIEHELFIEKLEELCRRLGYEQDN